MNDSFRSRFIPAEVVRELPDLAAGAILEEQRAADERAMREEADRRSDAQIITDEQTKKRAQLSAYIARTSPNLDPCDDCGKSRSMEVLPQRYQGRFGGALASPVSYCACGGGPVHRVDEWAVSFVRDSRTGYALAFLHPSSKAYGPTRLNAKVGASDLEAREHIVTGSGFEWAEVSNACRRLAFTILALVAGDDRADRYADAFMREWLAVRIAKQSERTQSVTLGEVREWLTSREAAAGAAA